MSGEVWYVAECRVVVRDGPTYSREAVAQASTAVLAKRLIREEFTRDFHRHKIKVIFDSIARQTSRS